MERLIHKFFHPFQWLKTFLPKTLLGRSLIILIAPVILVQITTTYVFIDRHWSKMTQLLAANIAGETAAVLDLLQYTTSSEQIEEIQAFSYGRFGLEISLLPPNSENFWVGTDTLSWREKYLYRELSRHLSLPFKVKIGEEILTISIGTLKGTLQIQTETKRLFTKTTPILLWWALGTPLLFLFIAVVFMRNQVRPLMRLSKAVDQFGKGNTDFHVRPSGALEIRKLTEAFNDMRERILRQISQRTEMLAGISHDLRTPLTRMELQLALLEPTKELKALKEDVKEMEKMVEEYLAFARGEEGEKSKKVNLVRFIKTLLTSYPKGKIVFKTSLKSLDLLMRQNAFRRCLTNLLNNALRYGKHAWVTLHQEGHSLFLMIEDDGPGIPEKYRQAVLRPFFRLESSRNTTTGGTGLGLSIAQDIVLSHGGTLRLEASDYGGLKVILTLPL